MRQPYCVPRWSVCLIAAAVAACGGSTDANRAAADSNLVEAEAAADAPPAAANDSTAAAVPAAGADTPANDSAIAAPKAASEHYAAFGFEPGWGLAIDKGRIDYRGNYGETLINVARPEPQLRSNGRRYVTDRLTVDLASADCVSAEGATYEHQVTITADGETYTGCGGEKTKEAE